MPRTTWRGRLAADRAVVVTARLLEDVNPEGMLVPLLAAFTAAAPSLPMVIGIPAAVAARPRRLRDGRADRRRI